MSVFEDIKNFAKDHGKSTSRYLFCYGQFRGYIETYVEILKGNSAYIRGQAVCNYG